MKPKTRATLEGVYIDEIGIPTEGDVEDIPTEDMLVELLELAFERMEEMKDHSHHIT